MRRLWQDARTHRLALTIFVACWLAVWWLTAVTWVFDEAGEPLGMHPLAILLHVLMPFTAGAVVAWWRQTPGARLWGLVGRTRAGMFVGLLVMEANLAILFAWDAVMASRLGLDPGLSPAILIEVLDFGLLFGVIGVVQGAAGGLASGLLAIVVRRVRRR